jgi:hypothetical protein
MQESYSKDDLFWESSYLKLKGMKRVKMCNYHQKSVEEVVAKFFSVKDMWQSIKDLKNLNYYIKYAGRPCNYEKT